MKKIFLSIILTMFLMLVDFNIVKADSFELVKGEALTTFIVNDKERHIYAKYEKGGTLDTHPLFCVSGINILSIPGTYNLLPNSGLTERQLLDIANIINYPTGTYVDKEFAIFTYLDKPGKRDNTHIAYTIMENAKKETDTYLNSALNLSSDELIFTLEGDYYKSQSINVTSEANIEDVSYSVTASNTSIKPSIEKNNNSFRVLISKEEVSKLSELEIINVTVSANKVNPMAAVYYIDDTHQEVTKVNSEVKKSITKTIEGSIGITKLVINKQNEDKENLEGAKLKIECISDGCSFETKEIVTTQTPYVLENIPYGKYKITEIEAPNGYQLSNETFELTLSIDHLVEEITIENKLEEVIVPDTLDSRSTLLLTLGMLSIALGIGVIIYAKPIKKNF